ncbi:hypothetical protein GC169_12945 [bacterium]|nr:hypothetical protein [bacterium]
MSNTKRQSAGEASLTGYWSGSYSYAGRAAATPFSAHIHEEAGLFSGETLEPNTFADPSIEELSASIFGDRKGLSVEFTKRYDPAPGAHQAAIIYSGALSADGERIDGEWRFAFAAGITGGFILKRVGRRAAAVEVARRADRPVKR